MAYRPDLLKDKDPNAAYNQPGSRSAVSSVGPSVGGGGPGAGGAPGGGAPAPRATPFLNLSTYLKSTQGAGAQQSQKAVQPATAFGQQTQAGADSLRDDFSRAVNGGTLFGAHVAQEGVTAGAGGTMAPGKSHKVWHDSPGPTGPGTQPTATPSGGVHGATPANGYWEDVQDTPGGWSYSAPAGSVSVAEAERRSQLGYKGPSDYNAFDKGRVDSLTKDSASVGRTAQALGTQGGREDLVRQQNEGYMSPFARALSGYTMGQEGAGAAVGFQQQFGGLSQMLKNRAADSVTQASAAKDFSDKNAAGYAKNATAEKTRQTQRWTQLGLKDSDFRGFGGGASWENTYDQYAAEAKKAGRPVASQAEFQAAKAAHDAEIQRRAAAGATSGQGGLDDWTYGG